MIGRPHAHHRLTDSTNERAKDLAAAGAPHGTLVTADEQTAGRGRQGRAWVAAPGDALLASVVVRDLEPRHALLPLMAALAVCDTAAELADLDCAIKWPNDVWVDRRKLSGILVEGRPQDGWAVVGVGVNVLTRAFPEELQGIATSLALECRVPSAACRVPAVLDALLAALDRWLDASEGEVIDAWRPRDALLGERIGWNGGEGVAAGIDETGALLVDTDAGRVALDAGEVHLRLDG
jgi:BirA family biotin operon repressor/biotin-[acetyl-CoA-carboxylase] ligase